MQTNSRLPLLNAFLVVAVLILIATLGYLLLSLKSKRDMAQTPVPVTQTPPIKINHTSAPQISPTNEPGNPTGMVIHTGPNVDVITSMPKQSDNFTFTPIEITSTGISFTTLESPLRRMYPFKNSSGRKISIQINGPKPQTIDIENNAVGQAELTEPGAYTLTVSGISKQTTITIN